jgi:hypothetical protein
LLTSLILAFLMFMSEYDFEILGMNLAWTLLWIQESSSWCAKVYFVLMLI